MNIKQNPFGLYDFLGYFTPGAICLYGAIIFATHLNGKISYVEVVATNLSFDKAEIYIPFVLAAYVLGHLLSFVSSITIERYAIWAHGYPSKYLLGIPSKGYFFSRSKNNMRYVMRSLVFVIMFPISLFDWILGKKAGLRDLYAKALDPLLIELLRKKTESLVDNHAEVEDKHDHGQADEVDFFRYAYHYAVENAPNHFPKMQNYVALYGFLRTLCFLSLIIFWALIWHVYNDLTNWGSWYGWMIMSSLITYLLFMAFVKFFRRFTLEALMAMAVTYQDA